MFRRRIFAGGAVPPHMYRALHINTAKQAARLCPSLAPLTAAATQCSTLSAIALGSPTDVRGALPAEAVEAALLEAARVQLETLVAAMIQSTHVCWVQRVVEFQARRANEHAECLAVASATFDGTPA